MGSEVRLLGPVVRVVVVNDAGLVLLQNVLTKLILWAEEDAFFSFTTEASGEYSLVLDERSLVLVEASLARTSHSPTRHSRGGQGGLKGAPLCVECEGVLGPEAGVAAAGGEKEEEEEEEKEKEEGEARKVTKASQPLVQIGDTSWHLMEISAGERGGDQTGVINKVANLLALARVSIFFLSNHQSDQFLIPKHLLRDACAALRSEFAVLEEVPASPASGGPANSVGSSDSPAAAGAAAANPFASSLSAAIASRNESQIAGKASDSATAAAAGAVAAESSESSESFSVRPFAIVPIQLRMASLPREACSGAAAANVMRLMFYRHETCGADGRDGRGDTAAAGAESKAREAQFFSITAFDGEISLVLNNEELESFPQDTVLVGGRSETLLRVDAGPLGFDEYGIVYRQTQAMAQAGITRIHAYISTWLTDHLLVDTADLEAAADAIEGMRERNLIT